MVAYFSYVGFNATRKTGQKTSNIVQVIEFAILHLIALNKGGYIMSALMKLEELLIKGRMSRR